ncbi:MAG: RHS repeat-associated core domain-containing protein [Christensenellaceae bacterium]
MIKKIFESNEDYSYASSQRNASDGSTSIFCSLRLNEFEAKKIKFSKAVVELSVTVASTIDRKVYYDDINGRPYLIDVVKGQAPDGKLYLDVTDEYQDAINTGRTSIMFKIEGDGENYYSFDDERSKIRCEYMLLTEENPNSAYLDSITTSAGSGRINLNTGNLKFVSPQSSSGNKHLPINLDFVFNRNIAYSDNKQSVFSSNENYDLSKTYVEKYTSVPGYRIGKGWKLSCQQYLLKKFILGFEEDPESSERYTWIDAEGNEIDFEEKYYYLDANKKRVYVPAEDVTIHSDKTLTYVKGDAIYDVIKECVSENGYELSTDNADVINIDKYNSDTEEIASLKKQIKAIKDALNEINGVIYTKGTKLLQLEAEVNTYNSMLSQIKHTCASAGYEKVIDEFMTELNSIKSECSLESSVASALENSLNKASELKVKLQELMAYSITATSFDSLFIESGEMKSKLSRIKEILSLLKAFLSIEDIKSIILNKVYNQYNLVKYYEYFFQSNSFVLSLNESVASIYQNFLTTKDQFDLQNIQLNSQIDKYEEQKELLEDQLETYLRQYPTHIIKDPSNSIIFGFAKFNGNSQFRLIMIADKYENCIFYGYDRENKLVSIVDSDNNVVKLDYENGLLSQIIDADGKEITLSYNSEQRLDRIINNRVYNNFYYNDDGYLIGAYNFNDILGVGFGYTNDNVVNTHTLQKYKSINGDSAELLTSDEIPADKRITLGSDTFLMKDLTTIYRYDYQTVIVTDKTNDKSKTYLFDNKGNLVSRYDNNIYNAISGLNVDSISYSRKGTEVSFEASSADWSVDYAENCEYAVNGFDEEFDEDWYYYSSINDEAASDKSISKTLSATEIQNIKDNKVSCLVLSGWAIADSAWINAKCNNEIDNNNTEYGDELTNLVLSNDADRVNRKFELRIELTYSNSSYVQKYCCSYDWMNTNWQYLAVPVRLNGANLQNLTGIKIIFDYSNNYGYAHFFGMKLKEGNWRIDTYLNNKLWLQQRSDSAFVTEYLYDNNGKVEIMVNSCGLPGDEEDTEFTSRYYYNSQGKISKTIDCYGMVNEYVYDSYGNAQKELVYHKDEPANKFVTERVFDEKGVEIAQIGVFGEQGKIIYDSHGNVSEQTDALGNRVSFGYDENGTLVNMTANSDGEPSSNVNEYNHGLFVKTAHNGCIYEYGYDGEGRVTGIKINGQNYCTIEYDDTNTKTVTYANGEKVRKKIFDDGNKFDVFYAENGGGLGEPTIYEFDRTVVDTQKDVMSYKEYVEDRTNGAEARYKTYYDKKNRVVKTEANEAGYGEKLRIANTYGFENALIQQKVEISNTIVDVETRSYEYGLKNKLKSIEHRNAYNENPVLDKLGRLSSVKKSNGLSKNYNYIQVGDRATTLLASETFGESGKTKQKLSYVYNKNGNVTEIRNDGELIVRYGYDSLNRLVREDNKELGKSFFISYDTAGNITQKKQCDFTLDYFDNLEKTVTGNYEYADNGNKDKLLSFNGEACSYDVLSRPVIYRNKAVNWYFVNRLSSYDGVQFKYNYNGVRLFKTVGTKTTKFFYDGAKLLCQNDGTDNLYFYYGTEGVTAFRYNGAVYHYKKDMFGNILGIYDANGNVLTKYVYDAWGNHKTFALNNGEWVDITSQTAYNENSSLAEKIAILNPFRYRSYYFDIETGLYYLQSRYYDPETGRFISPDDISYLDPETIHGLNLFAYCLNNPVMAIDPSGYAPSWLQGLAIGLAIIGAVLVVSAITVLTCGVGTLAGTMAGAVIYGAAQGIVIGAVVGVVGGGIVGGIASDWSTEGILIGMGIGLGVCAIVGGIIGGFAGASSFTANSSYISQYGGNVKEVLSAYKGNPRIKVLNSNTIAYRTWGGASGQYGHWISPKNYGSAVRSMLSLPQGNTAVNTSQFLISKGSTVLSGKAAALFGQTGGGIQWWIGLL